MNNKGVIRILPILILIVSKSFAQCNDFVRVDGKKFKCGQSDFFPVVVNYVSEIHHVAGNIPPGSPVAFPTFFPTRFHAYSPNNTTGPYSVTQQQSYDLIVRDFQAMKAIGFNTVRVVGSAVAYGPSCDVSWDCCDHSSAVPCSTQVLPANVVLTPRAAFWSFDDVGNQPTKISPSTSGSSISIYDQLMLDISDNILKAAKQAGLKVILNVASTNIIAQHVTSTAQSDFVNYLQKFATKFKYNPELLAVDFMNEPTVSGNAWWSKTAACQITKTWNDAVKSNSPILTTMGLYGIGSTAFWDPNLLPIDFVSLHTYPTSNSNYDTDFNAAVDRIKSDFFWYKNNVTIPWIIGETGISAHPSNQTYPINTSLDPGNAATTVRQGDYLDATIYACKDYGGAGYSWWTFMDEGTYNYTNNNGGPYWGLAKVHDGNITTPYDWKPAAAKVTAFNPNATPGSASQPSNYNNYLNTPYTGFSAAGRVVSAPNIGIKDAIVEVLDASNKYFDTYTDANGYFYLNASNNILRMQVTATECDLQTAYYNSATITNAVFYLTKIPRPTTNTLNYANQNVSNVNVTDYAVNDANFNNYQIASGNFKITAGSVIKLNTGFNSAYGSNFTARIGAYYHDCSTLVDANNAPFRKLANTNSPDKESENKIFPNPGTGNYQLQMVNEDEYFIDVFNVLGVKVISASFVGKEYKINIENEVNGVYMVTVRNKKGINETAKIIKE